MAQHSSKVCVRCGTPVPEGQRFCSNCGTPVSDEGNKPTAQSSETPSDVSNMATRMSTPPPPSDIPSYPQYPSQGQPTPPPPPFQEQPSYHPVPVYAAPQKNNSGKVWRGVGCGVGIAVLILLVICGSIGFFVYRGTNLLLSSVAKTATATGSGYASGGASGTTPTLGPTTKTVLGTAFTYASVDTTIVQVQQAQQFADDTSTSTANGIIRLDLKEQNIAQSNPDFLYSSVARLLLPDGSKAEPVGTQNAVSPDTAVSRTNWVDFAVPTSVKPEQLTLIMGAVDDAQMSIPLSNNPDLAKYKAKTATPNKTTQYSGLKWTITSATTSWSAKAVQAKKGMMYLMVSSKIDNPSQNSFIGYYGSYIRLKAGDTTSTPESSTNFPTSFDPGSSGKTGDLLFLVPQGTTTFTLILLADTAQQVNQATIDFQVS